jgi:hypothetical protein
LKEIERDLAGSGQADEAADELKTVGRGRKAPRRGGRACSGTIDEQQEAGTRGRAQHVFGRDELGIKRLMAAGRADARRSGAAGTTTRTMEVMERPGKR